MTPDEARALLAGTTPGPWGYYSPQGKDGHYDPVFGDVPGDEVALVKRPADWHLIAAAPALAAMRAEMTAEYMALNRADENGEWHKVTPWSTEWPFRPGHTPDPRFDKVIRRYVTTPEEA